MGLSLATCSSIPVSPWENKPDGSKVDERTLKALNAQFKIRIWKSNGASVPDSTYNVAINELRRVLSIVDETNPKSEISRVNAQAAKGPVRVSNELWWLLELSQKLWVRSNGAFDVTFAPIQAELERQGSDHRPEGGGAIEDPFALAKAIKSSVGNKNLILDAKTQSVKFDKPGMKLGIRGLTKGWAVQKMAEKLQTLKLPGYAILGGNVLAAAGAALRDPSHMCVEHPNTLGTCLYQIIPTHLLGPLYLATATIAARSGHTYDPKYGTPKARTGGATIAGPDGASVQGAAVAITIIDNSATEKFLNSQDPPKVAGVYFESDFSVELHGKLEPYAKLRQLNPSR